jgi:hypothetical protein
MATRVVPTTTGRSNPPVVWNLYGLKRPPSRMVGMPPPVTGPVLNLVGFVTGAALYVLLLWMVWRERTSDGAGFFSPRSRMPLLTGVSGLIWNLGALRSFGLTTLGLGRPAAVETAIAFGALGYLPAVVVHSLLEGRERATGRAGPWLGIAAAYGLSTAATLMHLAAATEAAPVPSRAALWILTVGFTGLTATLLLVTRREAVGRRALWVAALAIFAVSALHFGRHQGGESWWIELIGHHASLPLALAILHQDYRFALADLFLKHAIALLLLIGVTLGLFTGILMPLLALSGSPERLDLRVSLVILALWISTAISFPLLRRTAVWLVDRGVLRRPNYDALLEELSIDFERAQSDDQLIEAVHRSVSQALGATDVRRIVDPVSDQDRRLVVVGLRLRECCPNQPATALVRILTVEKPHPALILGPLAEGRRLLSDDVRLLEAVARQAARRVDSLRVAQERMERRLREQEIQQLASESELRALRSQLHPHFLFNALTTIGHLIHTAPTRAVAVLLRLTDVLRSVLRRSSDDSSTLGEEIDFVASYLEIERARYEERLSVQIDVPSDLRGVTVPSLVLQPLVENAIKHGIAPTRAGGVVRIRAFGTPGRLHLEVGDTGVGFEPGGEVRHGVGLTNVRRRLVLRYGETADLEILSAPGSGTTVLIELPMSSVTESSGHGRLAGRSAGR